MACIGVILIETNCLWMRYTHTRIQPAVPFSIKIDTPENRRYDVHKRTHIYIYIFTRAFETGVRCRLLLYYNIIHYIRTYIEQ